MDLKTLVKNEIRPRFDNIPVTGLDLYQVDIVNTKGDKSAQRPDLSEESLLCTAELVRAQLPQNLEFNHIYIMVKRGETVKPLGFGK